MRRFANGVAYVIGHIVALVLILTWETGDWMKRVVCAIRKVYNEDND